MIRSTTKDDTIAAIATPQGKGGISIVRVSGQDSIPIVRKIFRGGRLSDDADRCMIYGHIVDGDETVDEVLVCVMKAPRSYTCEDVVEIQSHGGGAAARTILALVCKKGARYARPGEFTRRAFLNGRIDLVQAESVMEVVEARGREHLRQAERLMDGDFSKRIGKLIDDLQHSMVLLELNIEFLHQGHEAVREGELRSSIETVADSVRKMLATYAAGKRIRDGVTVVLTGKVNAGKSSLFNALLGRKRAIVHPEPGTTRDWIGETIELDGIEINLIDTAGIRPTVSEIEREGVTESIRLVDSADIVVSLTESTDRHRQPGAGDPRTVEIVSKSDLVQHSPDDTTLFVSTVTGEGIENLKRTLARKALDLVRTNDNDAVVMLERHRHLLTLTLESLERAKASIAAWSEEITTYELNEAKRHLEDILGKNIDLGTLDALFSRFCIGK